MLQRCPSGDGTHCLFNTPPAWGRGCKRKCQPLLLAHVLCSWEQNPWPRQLYGRAALWLAVAWRPLGPSQGTHLNTYSTPCRAKLRIQPLVSISFWPGVYPLFSQSTVLSPTTKKCMPRNGAGTLHDPLHYKTSHPMQQMIPSFSSCNRERTVMQNLLWDQATCPSPA